MRNPMKAIKICDWIWEKPTSIHRTVRYTFHHQTIDVYIDEQFMQALMLKVARAAFAVACFWGLSDIY